MPAATATLTSPARRLGDFLAESLRWCRSSAAHFRSARAFAAVSHLEVAGDIAADAVQASAALSAAAHRAEVSDREAMVEIKAAAGELLAALADGIDKTDTAAIRRAVARLDLALKHASHSAETDHDLAENTQVLAS